MTTTINLYGGPGTGKSTSAAYIFFQLKAASKNVELVREYVKEWAWEDREIKTYDQLYFLGKQIRRESMLYNKVDYLVSDSPVYLNAFYSDKNCPEHLNRGIQEAVIAYYEQAKQDGHNHIHIFLERDKPYNPKGRYQTEEEAKQMDIDVKNLLDRLNVKYITCKSNKKTLDILINNLLL